MYCIVWNSMDVLGMWHTVLGTEKSHWLWLLSQAWWNISLSLTRNKALSSNWSYKMQLLVYPFLFQIANAIPLLTQSDLDKAIEILDRSQHLNSLRILLSLPNGVTDSTTQQKTGTVNSLMMPPINPKVGSLFGNGSKPFYVRRRFCNVQNYV